MKFKAWFETTTQDIRFYGRDRSQYGFLSNFHPSTFKIGNITFPTVEHYYVLMKSDSPEYQAAILGSLTPGIAKRLGDANHKKSWFVQGLAPLRPNWQQIKYSVMEQGLRAKFGQNPELMRKLKATAPAILLEDSPTDLEWGTGPIDENGNFAGKNNLGKLLMKIRDE